MRHASLLSIKEVAAAVLLSFAATCAVIAATDPGAAGGASIGSTAVNRINKGNRLPQASSLRPVSSSVSPSAPVRPSAVPLACDRAFSPVAEPANAGIYLRCLS